MVESRPLSLLGLDRAELASLVAEAGEPAYRAQQIMEAVYRQRVESVEEISTLPQHFREQLTRGGVSVGFPKVEKKFESVDGTVRYLIGFTDGQTVETVWMPEGDGGEAGDGSEAGDAADSSASTSGAKALARNSDSSAELKRCSTQTQGACTETTESQSGAIDSPIDMTNLPASGTDLRTNPKKKSVERSPGRATICVSSQVGCAVDCQFCLTALLGMKRNLSAGEIVGQVCAVLKDQKVSPPEDRINLVFMGMGEPFLNYENFMKAVRLLVEGVGIAESRMTVSTAGIVPRIHDLGLEEVRPKLAISLNASNDSLRTRLMPLNRKWNLAALMAAAREFPLRNRERVTFEYVLLRGVNDARANAVEVVELLRGVRAKVNLIALNPGPGIDYETPEEASVGAFQKILREAGIPAFVRRPRGRDIYAACGQLKRTVELPTLPERPPDSALPVPGQ